MTSYEQANRNARTGQETLEASGRVIARRMGILSDAMSDPLHADHVELSRMSTEKVVAMTASAEALFEGTVDFAQTSYAIAEREASHGAKLLNELTQSRNLANAAMLQAQWGFAAWTRALSDSQKLTTSLLTTQARAMKPFHSAVTRNAQRLKA